MIEETLLQILGTVLLIDTVIYRLRYRIAEWFASHGPHSDSLPGLDELRKWRK